jgi:hypothetical protein
MEVGFALEKAEIHINEKFAASAPPHVPLANVISYGSMVLLRPAKPFTSDEPAIKELHQQLQAAQAEAARAVAERNAALQQNHKLQAELQAEHNTRQGLEQSISWRITKPARGFMRFIRAALNK